MLQLLKHKKFGSIEAGRIRRYIFYALGEIILVMIGILLALQVNNWNETRKDRNEEQQLYRTLINSLESDLEDVNEKMIIVETAIKAQEIFIVNSIEEFKDKYPPSEIENFIYDVAGSSRSFFPNYGMYDKITGNNQIDLIQSSEIQMRIIELYEQYYKRYNDLDLSTEAQFNWGLNNNYFSKIEDHAILNDGRYNLVYVTFERDYVSLNIECRKMYGFTYGI